ncbi:uncharacterized protein METZ01_LOCUS406189, partial [marine metagenome]
MADTSIRARLARLFSGNVIVRNIGGRRLKVADTSKLQYGPQKQLVGRYQRLFSSGVGLSGYSDTAMVRSLRLGLFRDYETMDSDSIISSALDIYSDESTMKNEYGDVLTITSDNDQVKSILH